MLLELLPFIICVVVAIIASYFIVLMRGHNHGYTGDIYCLMVTGKNEERVKLARGAVDNFLNQTYPNKRLVIVNHGKSPVMDRGSNTPDVFEFMVEKHAELTLGDLRNITLDLVPIDVCWTTWDDDDWRSPAYLSALARNMTDGVLSVSISKRIEYNHNTGFVWEMQLKTGFVFALSRKHPAISYMAKDTMEDTSLLQDMRGVGNVVVMDNDPMLYIRLVHQDNTSLYVDKEKVGTSVNQCTTGTCNYIERNVDAATQEKVIGITKKFYTMFK